MANRARLFSTDLASVEAWDQWREEGHPYYDSRHSVPVAWYFFFRPPDVRLEDIAGLSEVALVAERAAALGAFDARLPVLARALDKWPGASRAMLERFRDDIALRPGRFLVLNPAAVLDDEPERAAPRLTAGLAAIEAAGPTGPGLLEALPCVLPGGWKDADHFELNVVGYTYRGMPASPAWEPAPSGEGEAT